MTVKGKKKKYKKKLHVPKKLERSELKRKKELNVNQKSVDFLVVSQVECLVVSQVECPVVSQVECQVLDVALVVCLLECQIYLVCFLIQIFR